MELVLTKLRSSGGDSPQTKGPPGGHRMNGGGLCEDSVRRNERTEQEGGADLDRGLAAVFNLFTSLGLSGK